jgi:hypothetical protein
VHHSGCGDIRSGTDLDSYYEILSSAVQMPSCLKYFASICCSLSMAFQHSCCTNRKYDRFYEHGSVSNLSCFDFSDHTYPTSMEKYYMDPIVRSANLLGLSIWYSSSLL